MRGKRHVSRVASVTGQRRRCSVGDNDDLADAQRVIRADETRPIGAEAEAEADEKMKSSAPQHSRRPSATRAQGSRVRHHRRHGARRDSDRKGALQCAAYLSLTLDVDGMMPSIRVPPRMGTTSRLLASRRVRFDLPSSHSRQRRPASWSSASARRHLLGPRRHRRCARGVGIPHQCAFHTRVESTLRSPDRAPPSSKSRSSGRRRPARARGSCCRRTATTMLTG